MHDPYNTLPMSATTAPTLNRIDALRPGTVVELEFCGSRSLGNDSYRHDAVFLGVEGVGESREALFVSAQTGLGTLYKWRAYRFEGRWVYGSSAERLRVISQKFDV